MTRKLLACVAGLILAAGLAGCSNEPDIPEGYSEDDIRQPTDEPVTLPGRDIEGPEKAGG